MWPDLTPSPAPRGGGHTCKSSVRRRGGGTRRRVSALTQRGLSGNECGKRDVDGRERSARMARGVRGGK